MKQSKTDITCNDCKYLVHIPDGLSGKTKPSCCFYHEKHDLKTNAIQKKCGLFAESIEHIKLKEDLKKSKKTTKEK